MSSNQDKLVHIAEESISIINITKVEVRENRHAINALSRSLIGLDDRLVNMTRKIKEDTMLLTKVVKTYSKLNLIIIEIKEAIDHALLFLSDIKNQLNQLSQGRLSPLVINPKQLQDILEKIQKEIPDYLSLPRDPKLVWYYYQSLTSVTIIKENKFVTLVDLPLIDANSKYEIFKIINIPIPFNKTTTTAHYELESDFIAVNIEKTHYMPLATDDFTRCSLQGSKFCSLRTPIYSVRDSKLCIVSLYLNDARKINQNCNTIVTLENNWPKAYYLMNGNWLIMSLQPVQFSIICDKNIRYSKKSEPFLYVISLNITCTAL